MFWGFFIVLQVKVSKYHRSAAIFRFGDILGAATLKSSAAVPQLRCISRIDFQKGISLSLVLIKITDVIHCWKALSNICDLKCNRYTKNSQIFFEFNHKVTLSVFMLKTCLQKWDLFVNLQNKENTSTLTKT